MRKLDLAGIATVVVLMLAFGAGANGAGKPAKDAEAMPIFIVAPEGFDVDLAAAIEKKHTPAVVMEDRSKALYVLEAGIVMDHHEGGAAQIARCMFAMCIGVDGNSAVGVKLVRQRDSAIVWAYQVRKAFAGPMARQSLSEAIAKHLKDYIQHSARKGG